MGLFKVSIFVWFITACYVIVGFYTVKAIEISYVRGYKINPNSYFEKGQCKNSSRLASSVTKSRQ